MTDQELNEAVARRLGTWSPEWAMGFSMPYSTDIKSAWEVVEFCIKNVGVPSFRYRDGASPPDWNFSCMPVYKPEFYKVTANAISAPRAICEAFLKLHV